MLQLAEQEGALSMRGYGIHYRLYSAMRYSSLTSLGNTWTWVSPDSSLQNT